MKDKPVTRQDLSDFADGHLPRSRAARVAAHLRSHPEDADRLHSWWRQEAALRAAYDPMLSQPVPRNWTARHRRSVTAPAWAAVIAVIAISLGALWYWPGERGSSGVQQFTNLALDAFTQKPAVRTQGVEGAPPLADPRLTPVGERRIRLRGHTLTEYTYRDNQGRRIGLYEMRAGKDAEGLFRIFRRDNTRLVEWTAGGKRYAVVGKDSASDLTHLAVRIRDDLATPASALAKVPAINTERALKVKRDVMVQWPTTDRVKVVTERP